MLNSSPIAVASSVAADNNYDNLDALNYAIENSFQGFQPYITLEFAKKVSDLSKIASLCQLNNQRLIAHLPGTLTREIVENPAFNNAVKLLFQGSPEMRVIHHYDEHVPLEDALESLAYANHFNITVCLENFFKIPDGIDPYQSFQNYLNLLMKSKERGLQVVPVFDIPRLYDERLGLSSEKIDALWYQSLSTLQKINSPLILHLIDGKDIAQRQWSPIGQGKLPYERLFAELYTARIPIEMVVLEYEDRQNPLDSRAYLQNRLLQPFEIRHLQQKSSSIERVFIGSTSRDLAEYRQKAIEVALRFGYFPIAMEYFSAVGLGATEGSKRFLDTADLYIGIFAHRYGHIEHGYDKSVTEIEFDYAGERNLERLCFLVKSGYPWPTEYIDFENQEKLKAFKERINKLIRTEFTSVDNFGMLLSASLSRIPTSKPRILPPSPPLFLGRKDDLIKVRNALKDKRMVAMHGWPGVGKTTLAAALANDPETQELFPDIILWTALGENAGIMSLLYRWCIALGIAEQTTTMSKPKELGEILRNAFGDKHTLLLIDDVWAIEDIQHFLIGGNNTSYLITTRFSKIAGEISASYGTGAYWLEQLSDEQSLELLRQYIPAIVNRFPAECQELVQRLEGLPLSLRVAGGLLRNESLLGWEGLREYILNLQHDLIIAGDVPVEMLHGDQKQNLGPIAKLLSRSTNLLTEDMKLRFAMLSEMTSKPASFTLEMMQQIWEVSDPLPTVRTLVQYGLLDPIPGSDRHFQMHALLIAHAKYLLKQYE